ncbi:hypothetical protein GCM10023324_47790 [Streptomyces youssoufiensis]
MVQVGVCGAVLLPGPERRVATEGEGSVVVISLSVVLLVGIILAFIFRAGKIKAGPMLVAMLFGFLLASTDASPDIQEFLDNVAEGISDIEF